MNIFEHLGLPADHRKENKTTQLVKHWHEVPESRKDGKEFAIQKKKDGVCAIVVVDELHRAAIFSRTGRRFTNVESLEAKLTGAAFPDGVYFGELCLEDVSLEVLSGMVNPNRTKPLEFDRQGLVEQAVIYFFDMISLTEFEKGESTRCFYDRWSDLEGSLDTIMLAEFFDLLYPVFGYQSEESIEQFKDAMVGRGEEGIIIRDPNAGWKAGHKGWHVMKKVKDVDYDLRCIGFEEGTGKYVGKVANLLFEWKGGKTITAMLGKGWSHEHAEDMFRDFTHEEYEDRHSPLGCIFQVYALEESSKGVLRLPKVGELRHDKAESDV
mgnify:CR=1 FL=1